MEIKHKKWVDIVHRVRGEAETRFDKVRLDKNERVAHLGDEFWNNLLSKIKQEHILAYPEVEPFYSKLANFLGVSAGNLVITAGADFAIKIAFELFVNSGDEVIILSPTFAMIEVYSDLYNARKTKIGYDSNLNLDIEKLMDAISEKVSLIIIANPNSPTGTYINNDTIGHILEKAKRYSIPVLVDEAYWGFCPHTTLELLKSYENLIITRTFSKSVGLAGLRIGYIISSKKIASLLYKFRPMYEVNSIAILFASEMLNNWEIVDRCIKETIEGKKFLVKELEGLSFKTIDTWTNFIHVDFNSKKNQMLSNFSEKGILIKGGIGVNEFDNYVRITTGNITEMKKVINSVRENLQSGNI
ncbi:MAG: pyridoxal phosphate-dependent aminotransferase [Candidatus Scalinduaceae bacterium]